MESGVQPCNLVLHGTHRQQHSKQYYCLSFPSCDFLKLTQSSSCISTSQSGTADKETGRGDRLWSGKDGKCFSQYNYILANLSLVTCSIRLKSGSWFTVTCLFHCSDGHLHPQSKNIWSCESDSELHLYRQMRGADRNFHLRGKDSLVRSGRATFPISQVHFRGLLLSHFCCYPSSFEPLWSLLPCFLVRSVTNLDFTHEWKMSL